MAVGAKRWPPVWLHRHTRTAVWRAASSTCRSVPHRPQQASRRPCPHTSTSGGDSPTTLGRSRWSAIGSAANVASRSTTLERGTRWSRPSEVVGAGAPAMHDRGPGVVALVRLGQDRHHAHPRGGRRGGQLRDLRHVVRPGQRPLHEEQGVEAGRGADRVDALGLGPRRAPERRIVGERRPLDSSHRCSGYESEPSGEPCAQPAACSGRTQAGGLSGRPPIDRGERAVVRCQRLLTGSETGVTPVLSRNCGPPSTPRFGGEASQVACRSA